MLREREHCVAKREQPPRSTRRKSYSTGSANDVLCSVTMCARSWQTPWQIARFGLCVNMMCNIPVLAWCKHLLSPLCKPDIVCIVCRRRYIMCCRMRGGMWCRVMLWCGHDVIAIVMGSSTLMWATYTHILYSYPASVKVKGDKYLVHRYDKCIYMYIQIYT